MKIQISQRLATVLFTIGCCLAVMGLVFLILGTVLFGSDLIFGVKLDPLPWQIMGIVGFEVGLVVVVFSVLPNFRKK